MNTDPLNSLVESYPPRNRNDLVGLASRYQARQESEILEVAAIAADVSLDSFANLGLEPEANPLLYEAFQLQNPNVDIESLAGASDERLEGFVNSVKGDFFEVLVAERLNRGESVGELTLGPGQIARLAESPTQEGWDLGFYNAEDGSLVDVLQLKATTSLSYVKTALVKNPDIKIATTSDIQSAADNIIRTDITNAQVEDITREQLGEASEGLLTDVFHQTAEWAFDAVPIIPAVLILATEGQHFLVGQTSLKEAFERSTARLGKSAIFTTLGATLMAMDLGVISIPTTAAARIAWARVTNRIAMGEFLQSKTEELSELCLAPQ